MFSKTPVEAAAEVVLKGERTTRQYNDDLRNTQKDGEKEKMLEKHFG